ASLRCTAASADDRKPPFHVKRRDKQPRLSTRIRSDAAVGRQNQPGQYWYSACAHWCHGSSSWYGPRARLPRGQACRQGSEAPEVAAREPRSAWGRDAAGPPICSRLIACIEVVDK